MKARRRTLRLIPIAAAVAMAFPVHGQAQVLWSNVNSGFWDVGGNWALGVVPGSGANVEVRLAGVRTISYRNASGAQTMGSLLMDTGTNTLEVTGGSLTISGAYTNTAATSITGGALVLNGASTLASLSQSSGSLAGTGTVTVTGTSNITFGDHRGSGTTQFDGNVTISSSGLRIDGGRVLNFGNGGTTTATTTWTGGQILLNNTFDGSPSLPGSGTINVRSNAVFIAQGDSAANIFFSNQGTADNGTSSLFTNAGTFRKAGSSAGSVTALAVQFTSTGTVDVQSGTLSLDNGSSITSGTLTGAGTGTLRFGNGIHTVAAGVTINVPSLATTGSGTVTIEPTVALAGNLDAGGSGTLTFNNGLTVGGTTTVSGARVNVNGVLGGLGTSLTVSGGVLNTNAGSATVGTLSQSSGGIAGTGTLTVTGTSNITFGDHRGTGTTQFDGNVLISSSGLRIDGARVLNFGNGGTTTATTTWTGGQIVLNNTFDSSPSLPGSGTINVRSNAVFIAQGDSAANIFFSNQGTADNGTSSLFTNAGTVRKAGSSAGSVTALAVQFTNTGTVDVQSGTLSLDNGSSITSGTLTGAGTGTLRFGNGIHTVAAGVTINVPSLATTGSGTVTIEPTVALAGNLDAGGSGTLTFNNGLTVGGTTTVSGARVNVNGVLGGLGTSLTVSGGVLNTNAGSATVGTLSQSSGGIAGTGTLTVTGTSNITFGDHRGTGTTQFDGNVLISSSGLRIDGARVLNFGNGGTTTATTTWTGGQIVLNNTFDSSPSLPGSGTINVRSNAVFIAQGDSATSIFFSNQGTADNGTSSLFTNAGTVRKAGSSAGSNTSIDVRFTNTGTVDVQTGTLSLTGGSSFTGGSVIGAGRLNLGGGASTTHTFAAPSTIAVAALTAAANVTVLGTYNVSTETLVSDGTLDVSGATLTSLGSGLVMQGGVLALGGRSPTVATLTQSSGGIAGTGTLTIAGAANITFGEHRGSGTTQFNGPVAISSSGFRVDGGRTVNFGNGGTTTWTGGQILFNETYNGTGRTVGSGTINVQSGALFLAQGNSASSILFSNQGTADSGADSLFSVAGTFRKAGSSAGSTTTISTQFTNTGTVDVQTGTLTISGVTGTLSGTQTIASGAALEFGTTGTVDLSAGSTTGTGTLRMTGSGVVNVAAAHTNAATLGLAVTNGLLNLEGDRTFAVLNQSSGGIAGTGTLTIAGAANITFGEHRGSGTTQFNGPVAISSSGFRVDGGRTVNFGNGGTTTWTGGQILFNETYNGQNRPLGSGTINVQAGALFLAQGNGASSILFSNQGTADSGADSLFSVAGTFRKAGSTAGDTTTISTQFTNTGTVDVQTGTLTISGVTGTLSGTQTIASGAALEFGTTGTVNLSAGSTTGTGTLRMTGSGVVNVAAAHTNAATLGLAVTNGLLNLEGDRTFAVLNQSSGGIAGTGTLTIAGAANITFGEHRGSGTTQFNGPVAISSSGFRVDGGRTVNFGNGGTTTWTSGQILFNETYNGTGRTVGSGTINVQAGALFVAQGDSAGSILFSNPGTADNGADSLFSVAGTFRKAGSSAGSTTTISTQFTNTGTVDVQTGTLTISGVTGTLSGTQTIASGAALEFGTTGTVDLSAGSTTGTGSLRMTGSGVVNVAAAHSNAATLGLAVTNGLLNLDGNRTFATLTQSFGAIGGTGTLTIAGAANITFGEHRGSGTTQFNGPVAISSSGFRVDGGRTVNFGNGGTTTWTSGQILFNETYNGTGRTVGSGTINVQAGALFVAQGDSAGSILFSNPGTADNGADSLFSVAGTFRKAGSSAFNTTTISTQFTNTGTVDVQTGTLALNGVLTNRNGGTLTGGIWQVRSNAAIDLPALGSAITTNAADIQLFGAGSRFQGRNAVNATRTLDESLVVNATGGSLRLFGGRVFTQSGGAFSNAGLVQVDASTFTAQNTFANTSTGTLQLVGGTFNATGVFSNAGTLTGFGTVNPVVDTNTGTIIASGGTLAMRQIIGGSGTVQVNAGGTLDLTGSTGVSSADNLIQNGSLNLGANNFNVLVDYTNANFGVGNAFSARAGVTGAQIVGVNAAQTLTATGNAANLTGGSNAFTLDFGNVRGNTFRELSYQILNNGTGARIRGAVQTGAPGLGNITDTARLSGSGVTAANFGGVSGLLAGANSGDLVVRLNAPTGPGATGGALSGQNLAVVSNFSTVGNMATQTLNITGFTTVLANGSATPVGPIDLGNFRVTQAAPTPASIAVTNTTTGAGAERLAISGVSTIGNFAATNVLGSGFVAPGATQGGAVTVNLQNGIVGENNGTVTIQFGTNGQGVGPIGVSDPAFATQNANSQAIAVTAQGFLLAQPALPASVNVGNFRVVQGTTASTALTLTNTPVAPVNFQEKLDAQAVSGTNGVTVNGTVSLLARGDSSSALTVGFAAGGATGDRSGVATIALQSNGDQTSGITPVFNLANGQVTVNGTGFALAQPNLPASPINLGNFRVGATPTTSPTITNTLVAAQAIHQEALLLTPTSTIGSLTLSGAVLNTPLNPIAAGGSGNQMVLGLSALTAGANSGTLNFNRESSGAGTSGLANFGLGTGSLTVIAAGYNTAVGSATVGSGSLNLGNFRVGLPGGAAPQTVTLDVANTSPTGVNTERLGIGSAVIDNPTAFTLANSLGSTLVSAGTPATNALSVQRIGGIAGTNSGTLSIQYRTDGAGTSGLSAIDANLQTLVVSATGFNTAVGSATVGSGSLNLGNFRVGLPGGAAPQTVGLNVANTSPTGVNTERLAIGSAVIDNPTAFALTNSLGSTLVSAGTPASNALSVQRIGGIAGTNTGTLSIQYRTDGAGTSGLSAIDANLQTLNVTATGFNTAVGSATVGSGSLNLGNFRVGLPGGAAPQTVGLNVANTSPTGVNTERLAIGSAVIDNPTAFTLTNSLGSTLVSAGAPASNALSVQRTGGVVGANTGTLSIQYRTDGAGTSGLSAIDSNLQTLAVSATGFQVAQPQVPVTSLDFGNFRVGSAPAAQTVVVNNPLVGATALQQEALQINGGATTNGVVINGLATPVTVAAAGGSGSAITVGVSGAAGSNSGTATLNFRTDGTGTSNLGVADLLGAAGSATLNVTGAGYVPAAFLVNNPSALTLNFGTVIRGTSVPVQTGALSFTNSATGPAGFVENLNARFGSASGTGANLLTGQGSVTDLRAGQTDATMRVVVDTNIAGTVNASIPVNFFTSGRVFNGTSDVQVTGLSELGIGSATFVLDGVIQAIGQVANPASPRVDGTVPVNLGNVRAGSLTSPTGTLGLTNVSTSAPQADLNASVTGTALVSASGGVNRLAPGASTPGALNFSLTTAGRANAGAVNETVTIAYQSDLNTLGNCAPNCVQSAGTGTVQVQANVFRLGTGAVSGAPLDLGAFRLSGIPTLAGSLGARNSAAADGFSEQAGIESVSASAGFTATNTLGAIRLNAGAGVTPNAVNVGLASNLAGLVAGSNSGQVTVNFLSDGTVSGTGSPVTSNSQIVNVNATGYNVAVGRADSVPVSGATPVTVTVANQRIGGAATAALSIANTAPTGFTEVLNASFGAAGANATNNVASITGGTGSGVAAGASNTTTMAVGVNTSAEGLRTGTQVVNFQSNGTGTSGLGTIDVGSQTLNVQGNVFRAAIGQLNTAPLNIVTQVGTPVAPVNLSFTNTATGLAGFVEDLKVTFGAITGSANIASFVSTNGGQMTGILAGATSSAANGTMSVSINTSTAGTFNGAVGLNFFTQGAVNGVLNGLGELGVGGASFGVEGTINTTVTVVNQANPQINNSPITIAARVGDTLASTQRAVSISNVAGAPPQAALTATGFTTASSQITTNNGSFSLLAPGGTDNASLRVGLASTATAGSFTGQTASVALVSDASNQGCTVNCTANLAAQNVSVNGKVYLAALPTATNVDFGVRRVSGPGSFVSATSTITNTQGVAALNDTLAASFTSTSGTAFAGTVIGGPNSVSDLQRGGGSGTLGVSMSTANAGVFSGATAGVANIEYRSQNTDMVGSDLISTGSITLTGTVNNIAQAAFKRVSGPGSFSEEAGNTFRLDFGNVSQGSILTARLAAWNRAPGAPSDSLKGTFSNASSGSVLSLSGFNAFGPSTGNPGLAAGEQTADLIVDLLNSAPLGFFSQTIQLSGVSYFTGLSDLVGVNASLVLSGTIVTPGGTTVIPLPPAAFLMLGGLAVFGWMGRRRQGLRVS
jgi:hypothetical protein